MTRIRKLTWLFKTIRHIADKKLLKLLYISLVQPVLVYCIPVWGCAAKTRFLELERTQRTLLKIMNWKPYRFPTTTLYKISDLLTVRQLYILNMTLKLHKTLPYDLRNLAKRRKHNVAPVIKTKTHFAKKQFVSISAYIYNKINKILNIYPMQTYSCKSVLTTWLKNQNYNETEALCT